MINLFGALKNLKLIDEPTILSQVSLAKYNIGLKQQIDTGSYLRDEIIISDDEVHAWTFPLNLTEDIISFYKTLLSQDELSKTSRLRSESVRKRFISGRGWMRLILSQYTGIAPETLNFSYNYLGKPQLSKNNIPNLPSGLPLFNLSHSNDQAMLAITRTLDVGIDLEFIHPIAEMSTITRRYFSHRECAYLAGLPEKDRVIKFFQVWTAKEALIKAQGQGFSIPFNTFSIVLSPQDINLIVEPDEPSYSKNIDINNHWTYIPIQPPHGYVASLAVERKYPVN